MGVPGEKYRPSNGSEGMVFADSYCDQCVHECWSHTQNDDDVKCDVLNRMILLEITDEDYPKEIVYGEDGFGTCTKYQYHKWRDDITGNINFPPEGEYVSQDPDQLSIFEDGAN